jgi:hypothetical protein
LLRYHSIKSFEKQDTQDFEHTRAKFEELVQEKDAAMGEGELTRIRPIATTDQTSMAEISIPHNSSVIAFTFLVETP